MATYNIVVTQESGGTNHFYYNTVGTNTFTEVSIPTGVTSLDRRPDKAEYRKRHYLVGPYSANIVFIDVDQTLVKAGITEPASAPTVALIPGPGAILGDVIYYLTYRHNSGGTLVHESSGGPASASLSTTPVTGSDVAISDIPATSSDARVTHVGIYRSTDGADPRFVDEVTLGTTTFTDDVATAALGGVMPTNNGVPPPCRFIFSYHDRMWYAGIDDNPDRVYYSEISLPEAVGENSYIPLRDGEAVTSISRVLDQLACFARNATYDIQGYTASDFVMRKLNSAIGCISHFALRNIQERLVFPAVDGVYVFNGASFDYMMENLRDTWRADYVAHITEYNDAVAVDDREFHIYKLLIHRTTTPKSFYWVGHYLSSSFERSAPFDWTIDRRDRSDSAVGALDAGNGRWSTYTGSEDGIVRRENQEADADDDGDTYLKHFILQTKLDFFDDLGGGPWHAKRFTDLDLYVKAEENPWTVAVYAGEEDAADALTPNQGPIAIGASRLTVSGKQFLPKQQHYLRLSSAVGKGLALRLEADSPVRMSFRGFGGVWQDGVASRLRQT